MALADADVRRANDSKFKSERGESLVSDAGTASSASVNAPESHYTDVYKTSTKTVINQVYFRCYFHYFINFVRKQIKLP